MPELRLIDKLREFLLTCQGKEVSIDYLRTELKIDPASPTYQSIRKSMLDLANQKIVKPSGRKDGIYKVIKQVQRVQVFGRERKPPLTVAFPRDYNTMNEILPARDIIIREGDLILISGRSNFGKTALCLNFCAENIDSNPVLMGNEYTTIDHEPSPRFMQRLDNMEWIDWTNGDGIDKFELLPVFDDYAEHIIKDRMNIIDWINIDTGEFYLIGKIMEDIKRAVGKGIGVITIQKAEGADAGRGGQFTKDFADVEILLDSYGEHEILMTFGKVKESRCRVTGRSFAFGLEKGVKITNYRELSKCSCHKGWRGSKRCDECNGTGYKEKPVEY
ncbi:hypothetical protein LCGC14_2175010 [marine sediment metagenome]|uniref:Uncharacterized protein n=1 Tax=marine sediment metagenome TaxID=412755 RepID=A0A0F9GJS6_9ZZZZ